MGVVGSNPGYTGTALTAFIVSLSYGAYSPWGGWDYCPMLQMSKLRTLKSYLSHTANKQRES